MSFSEVQYVVEGFAIRNNGDVLINIGDNTFKGVDMSEFSRYPEKEILYGFNLTFTKVNQIPPSSYTSDFTEVILGF